jgi:hypothetical protein
VACCNAAALSGRLRARARAGVAAEDNFDVKVGFMKKSREPPLIVRVVHLRRSICLIVQRS